MARNAATHANDECADLYFIAGGQTVILAAAPLAIQHEQPENEQQI
jgi:hypothetical protein